MQVFDLNGHLYDIGYGPQHRDLGKGARSAILASMIGIGISVVFVEGEQAREVGRVGAQSRHGGAVFGAGLAAALVP
jgi:hypothetical protein